MLPYKGSEGGRSLLGCKRCYGASTLKWKLHLFPSTFSLKQSSLFLNSDSYIFEVKLLLTSCFIVVNEVSLLIQQAFVKMLVQKCCFMELVVSQKF